MSGISNIILGSCATVTKFSWLIELPVAIGKTCIPKKKKNRMKKHKQQLSKGILFIVTVKSSSYFNIKKTLLW